MSLSIRQVLNSNATDLNALTSRVTSTEVAAATLYNRVDINEGKIFENNMNIGIANTSISNNATAISALSTSKQDKINTNSEISLNKLNVRTEVVNSGSFLQHGLLHMKNTGAFVSEVDLVMNSSPGVVSARVSASGFVSAESLSYKDGAETVDVKTKVNQMSSSIQTLDDKLTGTITILSEDGGSYKLDEMLDIIVANKVKLDTFVQLAVDGATGDNDVGSVSLIETVAQNKADVFTNATALNSEKNSRESQDILLQQSIADTNLNLSSVSDNLNTEVSNRVADSSRLDSRIDTVDELLTGEALSRVDGDAAASVRMNGIDSVINTLVPLIQGLQTERTERVNEDDVLNTKILNLTSSLSTETADRVAGDSAALNNLNAVSETVLNETNARVAADSLLTTNLSTVSTALTSETQARTAADAGLQQSLDDNYVELEEVRNKVNSTAFCNVIEAEGILLVNDMPFSMGGGSPSKPGFGLSVPFNYKVVAYSIICNSTDTNTNVSFSLRNYKNGSTTDYVEVASNIVLGATKYKKQLQVPSAVPPFFSEQEPGNLCIIVNSVSGCVDVNARYRFSLFLQSTWALG
jgi:hypothetical protein